MGPDFWLTLAQATLDGVTLFVLLIGLAGLLLPIFPGLTVMWLATVFYAVTQYSANLMTGWDWAAFAGITVLMLVGSVVDNIIIARHVRDRAVPWSSILLGYAAGIVGSIFFTPLVGLVAAPAGLYAAESMRLKNPRQALASTRAWLTGWGWSLVLRVAIGLAIVLLWMLWAWA
jgi:uncharacterized protein YqgC (DUF456 family)